MAGKMKNRVGEKYGRLTVIKFDREENNEYYWICKCDCGNEIIKKSTSFGKRGAKSCGCLFKETRASRVHGLVGTRIYKTWQNMKSRCNNPNASKYYLYGGKGIKVCKEWEHDVKAFYDWAIVNGYRDDLTIDRIDPNKDYEPSNCRWATYKEQNSHLSGNAGKVFTEVLIEYNGERMNLTEWANKLGMNPKTLHARYERGWSI